MHSSGGGWWYIARLGLCAGALIHGVGTEIRSELQCMLWLFSLGRDRGPRNLLTPKVMAPSRAIGELVELPPVMSGAGSESDKINIYILFVPVLVPISYNNIIKDRKSVV